MLEYGITTSCPSPHSTMRNSLSLLLATSLLASSCSETPRPEAAGASGPTLDVGGAEPVSNWKSERKRLAMLGLDYDSGRAVVVPREALEVLTGLSETDLPALRTEGAAQTQANDMLAAIATYTRIVLLEPGVAANYVPLGQSLLGFKLERQADAAYRTGLEVGPTSAELNFRVADFDWRAGNFAEALAGFERAVELDPDHAASWGRIARAHFFAERDVDAWTAVHRAEKLGEPMPPQLRDRLAARTPEPAR